MCYCSDAEPAQASRTVFRRARKEHRCVECHRPIPAKSRHEYFSGVWDGSPDSFKTCLRCVRLRHAHIDAEKAVTGDRCHPIVGELREEIRTCMRNNRTKYLPALRKAWRGTKVTR